MAFLKREIFHRKEKSMAEYSVLKVEHPDWEKIPAVELKHTGWLEPCKIAAKAQLCHDGENLYVAMSRPLDYQVVETVHFIVGKPVIPVPCDPDEFDRAFLRYYPEKVDTVADNRSQNVEDELKEPGD
jgi:hypothetical protein